MDNPWDRFQAAAPAGVTAPPGFDVVPITGASPKAVAETDRTQADAEIKRLELIEKRRKLGLNDDGTPKAEAATSELTGGDFLKTLPTPDARMAKAIAEGRVDIPRGKAVTDPTWQRWIEQAMQYDPELDQANVFSRRATRRDFTSGPSAKNITAINTALGHLNTLAKAADDLHNFQNLGPLTGAANRVRYAYMRESGDPRTARFKQSRDAVANELMRVFRQVGASTTEIKEWQDNIDAAQSPDQLHASIQTAADLLGSRLEAINDSYKRGLGSSADVFELLSPHAQEIFHRYGYGGPTATGDGEKPPFDPNGEGEFGTLPPGSPMTPQQVAAYNAFLGSNPKATPEDLEAFIKTIGLPGVANAAAVIKAYRETGAFAPGEEAVYAKPDISAERGKGGDLETVDAFVRNTANTATANLPDFLSAVSDAALTDRTLSQSLAREQAINDYDWQNHAIASTAGTVTGALLVPSRVTFAARAAAKQALRAGLTREAAVAAARKAAAKRLAGEGSVYGAVHGAATSRGDIADTAAQMAVETVLGGAGGAVLPYIAKAAGAAGRAAKSVLAKTPDLANKIVFKTIKADGNTADDLARQASEAEDLGVPYMTGDSGENARGLLSASARAPGPGRTKAITALDKRQDELTDRVVSHIERDLGPVANPHKVADQLMGQASEAAGPLYEAAYARAGADAFGKKVAPLLQRPSMKAALGKAYRIAQEEGRDPTSLGFDINEAGEVALQRVPSWQTMDYVKRGMDDVVEGYRNDVGKLVLDTEGHATNNTLRQFLKAFDTANPDYAAARAAYGGPVSGVSAMNQGRKALNLTADDLEERLRYMTDFEREMFALGTRRAMAELVDSKSDTANVVHALVGTGKKRAMLGRLFGDRETFDRFVKTLEVEDNAFQTFKRARTGSPTAPNQQDDAALALASGVADLASTGAPIISALRFAARAKSEKTAKAAQDAVAAILGESDPVKVRAIIQRFRKEEARLGAEKHARMRRIGPKNHKINVVIGSRETAGRVGGTKAVPSIGNDDD